MKNLMYLVMVGVIFMYSCDNSSTKLSNTTNENEIPKSYDVSTLKTVDLTLNSFSFSIDGNDYTIHDAQMQVSMQVDKPKNLQIEAINENIFLTIFINLFEGVGEYPFANNDQGQGIAMSEIVIRENGVEKNFNSTEGYVKITTFDLDKGILDGEFSGSYFHQGTVTPEFMDVEKGRFDLETSSAIQ